MNDQPSTPASQPTAGTKAAPSPREGQPWPMAPLARPFAALRTEIDRLFDDFDLFDWRHERARRAAPPPLAPDWSGMWPRGPALDVIERADAFEIQAEVPGYQPQQIEVRLADGLLTIRGETDQRREEKAADYHLSERSHGSFQRALRLPRGIDADRIEARMAQGLLTLRLPKTAEARAHERRIDIKAG